MYDPCPPCARGLADGVYNIKFSDIVNGRNEYILPHTVAPGAIEKIQLLLGGSYRERSYLARIRLSVFTGSGEVLESKPFDVLVQNFDGGEEIPLDQLSEQRLREFISSGTSAPVVLTPSVIAGFFQGGNSRAERKGARVPPLPSWF